MKRNGWYINHDADQFVLARHWPPRFDVSAQSAFPPAEPSRLARQIRQDLWREFRHLRGFSPVVKVAATEHGVSVRAGGRLMSRAPRDTESRIQNLLDSPAHRLRWLKWAGKGAA